MKRTEQNERILFFAKILAVLITALAGAVLAVWFFGASTFEVEGIEFKVGLAPGRSGLTELHFPPFGVVEARTHQGPVKLTVNLEQIRSDSFRAHIENPPDQQELVEQLQNGARNKITVFAMHQAAAAFAGSFLFVFFIWRPNLIKALMYSVAAVLIISLLLLTAFRSYNPAAFQEPEYKGVLSIAPAAVKFATDSLTDLQQIRNHTREIISNLGLLFSSADSMMVMANPEEQGEVVKVLLISDLHSNPVGIELTKTLTTRFGADFVINAGDLTDMGTMLETSTAQDLTKLGVPHLFIAGNHDSPEIMEFVAGLPDGRVLDGEMITIKGLKVLGFADPLSAVAAVQYDNEHEKEEAFSQQIARVNEAVELQGRPDILVVHDSKLGKEFTQLAGLIVSGHDHRVRIEQGPDWVLVNPGTTGASGLRGFYSEKGISYSACIAYIVPDFGLLAVDIVQYNPVSGQFSLERKLLNAGQ